MKIDIVKIDTKKKELCKDSVAEEVFLTIHLDGREFVTLLCSPGNLKELSAGFLYSSGLIHSPDDIENIVIDTKNMTSHVTLKEKGLSEDVIFKRIYTSGCGRGMLFYNVLDLAHSKKVAGAMTLQSQKITELMKSFDKKSAVFKKTGGVHSAALSDGERIVSFNEDIGRHNAIDKIIGEALYNNLNMADLIVLTSGRISSEVMFKVQKMGSAVIVSRSAPTDLAVKLAKQWNVTLVGFARGKRMNVYSAPERIV